MRGDRRDGLPNKEKSCRIRDFFRLYGVGKLPKGTLLALRGPSICCYVILSLLSLLLFILATVVFALTRHLFFKFPFLASSLYSVVTCLCLSYSYLGLVIFISVSAIFIFVSGFSSLSHSLSSPSRDLYVSLGASAQCWNSHDNRSFRTGHTICGS